ncbi:hypothetical protein BD311DRAFT_660512 [Dichomitus squalens]|uniref:F-box domain-containing protein n=1 Tax=Dichomitus squalens TaxID=114155 RepID=A0A4Q9MTI6_9APHY|nr:hypothetical protein BD311DRAFT_660512 [Dichomitus squalens]
MSPPNKLTGLLKKSSHRVTNSGSAPHRALSDHDVLCVLFENNCVQNQGILTSADLRNCALVRRAFSEPVLRAMWQTMPSPAALWWLLVPEDKQTTPWIPTKDLCEKASDLVLNAEQWHVPERWSRFLWYARFVRKLQIPDYDLEAPNHARLLRTVLDDNHGHSVFPSLQVLWYSPTAYKDTCFYSLLTPRLRKLRLSYSRALDTTLPLRLPRDPDFEGTVNEIRRLAPGLQHLRIEPYCMSFKPRLIRQIATFEHLRGVKLMTSIPSTSFRILAAIPGLEKLHVSHFTWNEASDPCRTIYTPNLVSILVCGDSTSLTELFRVLRAPMLKHANICMAREDAPAVEPDIVACLDTFVQAISPKQLRSLSLHVGRHEPATGIPLFDFLFPLFALSKLTRVELLGPNLPTIVDDRDFATIALAWRELEAFAMPAMSWERGQDTPTPVALDYFRRYCPHLRSLKLPFLDPCEEYIDYPPPPPDGSYHGLHELVIGSAAFRECVEDLGISEVEALATYVLNLFPEVHAGCKPDWDLRSEPTWARVLLRARALREVRDLNRGY